MNGIAKLLFILGCLFPSHLAHSRHQQESAGSEREQEWRHCLAVLHPGPIGEIADYLTPYIQYGSDIVKHIIAVIYVESRFRADAISNRDAYGLMQMTEIAVREAQQSCGLRHIYDMQHLLNPAINLQYGVCYLRMLHTELGGDWNQILIVYNGGYTQLTKYNAGLPIVSETANYVLQINKALEMCSK